MDNTSLIMGLVILVIFLAPIIYLIFRQASQKGKQKKWLAKIAKDQGLSPDEIDFYPGFVLGLDSNKKQLIFVENAEKYSIVPLQNIKESHLSKKMISEYIKDRKKETLVHLSLDIIDKSNKKITEIVFYDEDENGYTDADVQLYNAKKWDNLLHRSIA